MNLFNSKGVGLHPPKPFPLYPTLSLDIFVWPGSFTTRVTVQFYRQRSPVFMLIFIVYREVKREGVVFYNKT